MALVKSNDGLDAVPEPDFGSNSPLNTNSKPLVEGQDFYREGQFLVFTATFLRRRGYCCKSGCRHCPYDEEAK
jgi:hypothetical protein